VLAISPIEQPETRSKFFESIPLEAVPLETNFRGIPLVDLRSLANLIVRVSIPFNRIFKIILQKSRGERRG
jgi:hypothetical protein